MKNSILFTVFLFLLLDASAQTGALQIIVTGIKSNKGDIKIAIYNESGKSGFLKSLDPAYAKKTAKINNGKATVTFTDIPFGTYAVSLFHDENSNLILDRAPLGYPIEAYGVSGTAKTIGPPQFEDCKFDFKVSYKKLNIPLQLWNKKKQP
jgi:uncharacterized protein (DUF2141 family)